jgi:hypothetical protein
MPRRNESWSISFEKVDPSIDKHCIYFKKDTYLKCRSWPELPELNRAIELRRTIIADAKNGTVSLDQIQEYIQCCCCTFGGHRSMIEEDGHLMPLAWRWRAEIWSSYAPASQTPTPSYYRAPYHPQVNPESPPQVYRAPNHPQAPYHPQVNQAQYHPLVNLANPPHVYQAPNHPQVSQAPYQPQTNQASPPQASYGQTPLHQNLAPSYAHTTQPRYYPGSANAISGHQPTAQLPHRVNVAPSTGDSVPKSAEHQSHFTRRSREVNESNSASAQSASDPETPRLEFRVHKSRTRS